MAVRRLILALLLVIGLGITLYLALTPAPRPATPQKTLLTHPNDPDLNQSFAENLLKTSNNPSNPQALPYLERAFTAAPNRPAVAIPLATFYTAQRRVADAQAVLEKCLASNPKDAPLHAQLANLHVLTRRYDAASREFDIAAALQPRDADLLCTWALMLLDAKKPAEAEQRLRAALEIDAKNPAFHMHLGRALREQGRIGSALQQFEIARTLDTTYAPAFFEAANTYLLTDDPDKAESHLRAALHLNPSYLDVQIALARLLMTRPDTGRRNLFEAIKILRDAVDDTKEQDLSLLVGYADALGRAELFDQALEAIDKSLALGNRLGLPHAQRELLLQRKQQFEVALAPPLDSTPSRLALRGTPLEITLDEPLPPIPQPSVQDLIQRPFDLSHPPAPSPPPIPQPSAGLQQ